MNIIEERIPEKTSLGKETDIQIQKYRESHTGLTQRGTHQNIVIKMAIIEDREYQKSFKRTATLYIQGNSRLSAEFSAETLKPEGSDTIYLK